MVAPTVDSISKSADLTALHTETPYAMGGNGSEHDREIREDIISSLLYRHLLLRRIDRHTQYDRRRLHEIEEMRKKNHMSTRHREKARN